MLGVCTTRACVHVLCNLVFAAVIGNYSNKTTKTQTAAQLTLTATRYYNRNIPRVLWSKNNIPFESDVVELTLFSERVFHFKQTTSLRSVYICSCVETVIHTIVIIYKNIVLIQTWVFGRRKTSVEMLRPDKINSRTSNHKVFFLIIKIRVLKLRFCSRVIGKFCRKNSP